MPPHCQPSSAGVAVRIARTFDMFSAGSAGHDGIRIMHRGTCVVGPQRQSELSHSPRLVSGCNAMIDEIPVRMRGVLVVSFMTWRNASRFPAHVEMIGAAKRGLGVEQRAARSARRHAGGKAVDARVLSRTYTPERSGYSPRPWPKRDFSLADGDA